MNSERSKDPILFFSRKEKEAIVEAIRLAEKKTSGEIRVHLERQADPDILAHARREFERLGMAKTAEKNGVLIFMGVKTKRFAVIGDQGINEKVPENFWEEIASLMIQHFKEDHFAEGLIKAITAIGSKLDEYFPYQRDDENELPDEISFSR